MERFEFAEKNIASFYSSESYASDSKGGSQLEEAKKKPVHKRIFPSFRNPITDIAVHTFEVQHILFLSVFFFSTFFFRPFFHRTGLNRV